MSEDKQSTGLTKITTRDKTGKKALSFNPENNKISFTSLDSPNALWLVKASALPSKLPIHKQSPFTRLIESTNSIPFPKEFSSLPKEIPKHFSFSSSSASLSSSRSHPSLENLVLEEPSKISKSESGHHMRRPGGQIEVTDFSLTKNEAVRHSLPPSKVNNPFAPLVIKAPPPVPTASKPISKSFSATPNVVGSVKPKPVGTPKVKNEFEIIRDNSQSSSPCFIADAKASTPEEKCGQVMREICFTEESFSRDLDVLCRVFLEPIRKQHLLSDEEIKIIFSNIESICSVSKKLLLALQNSTAASVGKAFLSLETDFVSAYHIYCKNQESASNFVDQIEESGKLKNFFALAKENPETRRLDLKSFLMKPVQRICKYPLLLKEIQKNLPPLGASFDEIGRAVAYTSSILSEINKKIADIEKLTHFFDSCGLPLSQYPAPLDTFSIICEKNVKFIQSEEKTKLVNTILTPTHFLFAIPHRRKKCSLQACKVEAIFLTETPNKSLLEMVAMEKKEKYYFIIEDYIERLFWSEEINKVCDTRRKLVDGFGKK
eukprot:TRINITY_DN5886_c0_g1_i1.p1 TRINITY_DN5886_c0_g1~~TRINITY_DN5886_c0_g1_i1.p1  ORF type:complete len:625 (-),score=161.67 TRINITY_DN5886_c0_g1_i1:9-1649(-)